MGKNTKPRRMVSTAQTVFEIIECLNDNDSLTATEIATEVDMAKSTIHDYLKTLEYLEIIVEKKGEYNLSLRMLNFGVNTKSSYQLSEVDSSLLEELAQKTECSVWVYVEEYGKAVIIETQKAPSGSYTKDWEGEHLPMHCAAGGKAILAYLPNERVNQIIDRVGLQRVTNNSMTEREEIFESLEKIRDQGYAVNNGETIDGIKGIASPVLIDGSPVGSISVSGPQHIVKEKENEGILPNTLINATEELRFRMSDQDYSHVGFSSSV